MSHEKLENAIKKTKRMAFPIILAASSIGCSAQRVNVSLPDCRYNSQPTDETIFIDRASMVSIDGFLLVEGDDKGTLDLYKTIRNNNEFSPIEKGLTFKDIGTERTVNVTAKKQLRWKPYSTVLDINSSCEPEK